MKLRTRYRLSGVLIAATVCTGVLLFPPIRGDQNGDGAIDAQDRVIAYQRGIGWLWDMFYRGWPMGKTRRMPGGSVGRMNQYSLPLSSRRQAAVLRSGVRTVRRGNTTSPTPAHCPRDTESLDKTDRSK